LMTLMIINTADRIILRFGV